MLNQPFRSGATQGDLNPRIIATTVNLITQQCTIDRSSNVKYGLAYGSSNKVFLIDKDMPLGFIMNNRVILTDKYLLLQGVIERALYTQYNLPTFFVEQLARSVAAEAVENDHINWRDYAGFIQVWFQWISAGKNSQPPTDYIYKPYYGEPTTLPKTDWTN